MKPPCFGGPHLLHLLTKKYLKNYSYTQTSFTLHFWTLSKIEFVGNLLVLMYSTIGLLTLNFLNLYWLSVNTFYSLDYCTINKPPKGVFRGELAHSNSFNKTFNVKKYIPKFRLIVLLAWWYSFHILKKSCKNKNWPSLHICIHIFVCSYAFTYFMEQRFNKTYWWMLSSHLAMKWFLQVDQNHI